jgi:hypothetical protein
MHKAEREYKRGLRSEKSITNKYDIEKEKE